MFSSSSSVAPAENCSERFASPPADVCLRPGSHSTAMPLVQRFLTRHVAFSPPASASRSSGCTSQSIHHGHWRTTQPQNLRSPDLDSGLCSSAASYRQQHGGCSVFSSSLPANSSHILSQRRHSTHKYHLFSVERVLLQQLRAASRSWTFLTFLHYMHATSVNLPLTLPKCLHLLGGPPLLCFD